MYSREIQSKIGCQKIHLNIWSDYQEMFAPVTRMSSIRVLISRAVNLGWNHEQLDVTNTFFHEDLKGEVYMEVPSGFNRKILVEKSAS